MKPATIDMLRAYLMTTSLAAVFIQAVVLLALFGFGMPEYEVHSVAFRVGVLVAVAGIVLATRQVAQAAYRSAVSNCYATFSGAGSRIISVSPRCPVRQLVILHLRFIRRRADLVESW
ncbi:hypothetical protein [Paraburkholderia sp.]|jgi:membrane protease YdiL (CAAX protease family)|uniref:hypothetical protein n=1 Tax=Paraburkholderia sp. TaxID=1926495 RepID=UPI002F3F941A